MYQEKRIAKLIYKKIRFGVFNNDHSKVLHKGKWGQIFQDMTKALCNYYYLFLKNVSEIPDSFVKCIHSKFSIEFGYFDEIKNRLSANIYFGKNSL